MGRAWTLEVIVALVAWLGLSLALFRRPTTPTVRAAALHYDAGAPWSGVEKFKVPYLRLGDEEQSPAPSSRCLCLIERIDR